MPKYSVKKPFTILVAVILVGRIMVVAASLAAQDGLVVGLESVHCIYSICIRAADRVRH
jgi:hypothetical protein